MTKLYDIELHKIFSHFTNYNKNKLLRDKNGFNFGWKYNKFVKSKKILYVGGCSWLHENFAQIALLNIFPNHLIINRAIGGQGNSMIIDLLEKDISLLNLCPFETSYLISFSEVGRNYNDFIEIDPKTYTNSCTYFEDILKLQYKKTIKILKNEKYYITTSFVKNCFNSNRNILDYCGENQILKPKIPVYNFSTGMYEWMKSKKIYKFDFNKELSILEENRKWFENHRYVDDTLHPNSYKPYEDFLSNLNL
jgi:hypothetical protein